MTKVILYMDMTLNAMVAKPDDDTPWSDDSWSAYYEVVKNSGFIILGRKTFEFVAEDENELTNAGNPVCIVVSNNHDVTNKSKNIYTVSSAKEAVDKLKELGAKTAILGGGPTTNSSFLSEGLIDEILLDIEPMIFGEGKPLFAKAELEKDLELLEAKQLTKRLARLRYKVL